MAGELSGDMHAWKACWSRFYKTLLPSAVHRNWVWKFGKCPWSVKRHGPGWMRLPYACPVWSAWGALLSHIPSGGWRNRGQDSYRKSHWRYAFCDALVSGLCIKYEWNELDYGLLSCECVTWNPGSLVVVCNRCCNIASPHLGLHMPVLLSRTPFHCFLST